MPAVQGLFGGAARGGKKSKGYKYAGSNNLDEVAWYRDNSGEKTHPVRQKKPNELGIYDMSGNVTELCDDWYDEKKHQYQRVLRGSSFLYKEFDLNFALQNAPKEELEKVNLEEVKARTEFQNSLKRRRNTTQTGIQDLSDMGIRLARTL